MLKCNYHTHTFRCGHAIGKDEDYVIEAIGMGIQELGFTDHVMIKGFSQPGVRGEFSMLEDYIQSIRNLKEKYKERIKIKIGFEAEPFPLYLDYYRNLIEGGLVDYLILGNHCELKDNHVQNFFSHATSKNDLVRYKDTLIAGMKSGLFKIVAHPDYFMGGYPKWDRTCDKISHDICQVAKKLDIPLEFNLAGIRRGKLLVGVEYRYLYPHQKFWEIAKKYNCKVILGLDAHSPSDISSSENDEGFRLAKEWKLNLISKIEI